MAVVKWLVWLFGLMLGWIAYDVAANVTKRLSHDPVLPILMGLLASILAVIVVWQVKRRMPERKSR